MDGLTEENDRGDGDENGVVALALVLTLRQAWIVSFNLRGTSRCLERGQRLVFLFP
jgi:hypothetical protein